MAETRAVGGTTPLAPLPQLLWVLDANGSWIRGCLYWRPGRHCFQEVESDLLTVVQQGAPLYLLWTHPLTQLILPEVVYCHPAYVTYMQSTSWETLGWKKHSGNQDCREKYQSPQICRWHHPCGRKWRGTKKPLDESKRGEWKSWLKAQHSENEHHGIWSHHFMGNRWGNSGNSVRLYFGGAPKSLQMVIAATKLKDAYSLEEKLWPT